MSTFDNRGNALVGQRTFGSRSLKPKAGGVTPTSTANIAGRIQVDRSSCSTRGSLYQIFVVPDNVTENTGGMPMRSVYVGVSNDVNNGHRVFTFTDHKVFTSPLGSLGATNGTDNIFPALAVDGLGYLYAVWSDNSNISLSSSGDQGKTWNAPLPGTSAGNAKVNGQPGYTFTTVACDNGSTSLDTFAISVSRPNGSTCNKSENLSAGFVHLTP